jgi:hypothetical protein
MLAAAMTMVAAQLFVVAVGGRLVETSAQGTFARLDLLCAELTSHGDRATSIPRPADLPTVDIAGVQNAADRVNLEVASATCAAAVALLRFTLLPAAPLGAAIARYGAAAGATIVRPAAPLGVPGGPR